MIQSYINAITPLISNTSSVVFQEDCIRTKVVKEMVGYATIVVLQTMT